MGYTKHKKVIISLFICLLAVCFIIRPVTAQEKASSVVNDRIEYYDSNPAYVAIDGSQVRTVVDMVDQFGEPFQIGFTLGNYYSQDILKYESTVVNVVMYDKNGKEIHTVGKNGNALGSGVRLSSTSTSVHSRLMTSSSARFYKNKETEGIIFLQLVDAGRKVLEIELEPDFVFQGINADIAIWNNTSTSQEFGFNYFHTVELDGDSKLPIKSLGENLGMYIENDKSVRINYTVNENFDRGTQYTTESDHSISTLKAAFAGFQPSNSLGLGWESKANDFEGTTIYNASSPPAISLKAPFQKVASGDYLSLNFTTGLSVVSQPPTIKPVQNKYDSVEGNKVPIKVTWSDHGSSKNDEGTIVVSGEGIPDTEAVYFKTKDKSTKETGTELIELDTRQLSPGIHELDLLITDATGATGHGKVQIDVKDGMKIELAEKLSGKAFETIRTEYEAKVLGSYVIGDIPVYYL